MRMDFPQRIPGRFFLPALSLAKGAHRPVGRVRRALREPFSGFRHREEPFGSSPRDATTTLREKNLCLGTQARKHGFKGFPVDWLDNEDRIARTTRECGARLVMR
jgi:hypothetical protein